MFCGGELECFGRVGNSCSTSGTRRATRITNPVIIHELEKDWIVITTNGTYHVVICDTDIP